MTDDDEHGYGDRAGEFLRIERGQYDATLYVVLAFIIVVAALWAPLCYGTLALLELETPFLLMNRYEWTQLVEEVGTGAASVSLLIAAWIFIDRWRCIEATASRYCSGVLNLSVVYVPFIAAAYALVRGARKPFGY
jgi:hypothetical protein